MPIQGSLVFTTINDPVILDDFHKNFQKFGHLEQMRAFVIPDKKSPAAIYQRCQRLREAGLRVTCPTLEEQEAYLTRVGFEPHLVPYNTDNRRNVGFLMALESGADFLISTDDDNFPHADEDVFAGHQIVCDDVAFADETVESNTGWYNICDLLEFDRPVRTYARGFPYYARHQVEQLSTTPGKARVAINAGLWLDDADVNAISWLENPVHGQAYRGKSVILGKKTWSPINSQNTGLRRDVLASYFYVRMGYPLSGVNIDRFGDILSGYFSLACARHLGETVRIGDPIADHRRNSHHYINDATNEWACAVLMEDFIRWLTEDAKLSGNTYAETYISLSYAIEDAVEKIQGRFWNDAARGFFHQTAYLMRRWAHVCNRLLGNN